MLKIIIAILLIALLIALVGFFLYAALVKSEEWNMPNAARAVGILVIGGIIVGLSVIGENAWFHYLNVFGKIVLGIGMLWLLVGLGEPRR
jgi:hypothetical protein